MLVITLIQGLAWAFSGIIFEETCIFVAARFEYVAVDQPAEIYNYVNIGCLCEQSHSGGNTW